jgi:chemotaxis receptor (MCP) glutamine deamidase CheD
MAGHRFIKPPNRIFLSSGTLFCAPTSSVITIVLGSCVAARLVAAAHPEGGIPPGA